MADGSSTALGDFVADPSRLCNTFSVDNEDERVRYHYTVQDTPGMDAPPPPSCPLPLQRPITLLVQSDASTPPQSRPDHSFPPSPPRGYGDDLNVGNSIKTIVGYVEGCSERFFAMETEHGRLHAEANDCRVDVCLYFVAAHRLKPIDLQFIAALAPLAAVIPIIAKVTIQPSPTHRIPPPTHPLFSPSLNPLCTLQTPPPPPPCSVFSLPRPFLSHVDCLCCMSPFDPLPPLQADSMTTSEITQYRKEVVRRLKDPGIPGLPAPIPVFQFSQEAKALAGECPPPPPPHPLLSLLFQQTLPLLLILLPHPLPPMCRREPCRAALCRRLFHRDGSGRGALLARAVLQLGHLRGPPVSRQRLCRPQATGGSCVPRTLRCLSHLLFAAPQ